MPQSGPPPKKTPEEQLREAVNNVGVAMVQAGFDAIDELVEHGKLKLKKALLQGLMPRGKKLK